jgi:hypothetical protein
VADPDGGDGAAEADGAVDALASDIFLSGLGGSGESFCQIGPEVGVSVFVSEGFAVAFDVVREDGA